MNGAVAAVLRSEFAIRRVQIKDVAPKLDISTRTLGRILNGEAEISITTLVGLADALDTTAGEIWAKATELLGS